MKINIEDDLIELILNNKKDNLSYRLTFIDMGPFIAPKNKYSDEKRVKI